MKAISRRNLIKGMVALPITQHASAQIGSSDKVECDKISRDQAGNYCHPAEPKCYGGDGPSVASAVYDTLNVIFHGLFLFIVRDEYVEVLAPRAKEHVYGGGNWYQEYRLREDIYTLTMKRWEGAHPKRLFESCSGTNNNVILVPSNRLQGIDPDDDAYCTLQLPFPDDFSPLGTFKSGYPGQLLGPSLLTGHDDDLISKVDTLGTAHVFTYKVQKFTDKDPDKPRLSNSRWYPEKNLLGAYNLHFFATPTFEFETPEAAASHSVHAFQGAASLLKGLRLKMKDNRKVDFQPPKRRSGIFGKEQGTLRACIPEPKFSPPAICDGASMFVV